MYQYKIEKVTRLTNTDTVTAILDLGFGIKTKMTFKLSRIEVPELDLTSDSDPEVALRGFIVQWLKTAPKPLYVHMQKSGKDYVGEILDNNGNVLAEEAANINDQTQVIDYGLPNASVDPSGF